METILKEELERCKKLIAEQRDCVEKLANALLEKDSLDIIQIKAILGAKPFPEDDLIKQVIAEVLLSHPVGRRPPQTGRR